MPNYTFTILGRQNISRYYRADIIRSRLIYKGCFPDNEEGHNFCKLNVIEWSRVLYSYFFCFQGCIFLIYCLYLIQGLIQKIKTATKHNIIKRALFKKKRINIILGSFRNESNILCHFKRNSSRKLTSGAFSSFLNLEIS